MPAIGKGHVDVAGYERADEPEKKGASTLLVDQNPALGNDPF